MCALYAAGAACAPLPGEEAPPTERMVSGAVTDGDRSGDLREEARSLLERRDRLGALMTVADLGRDREAAGDGAARAGYELPETIRIWRRGLDGSESSCSGRVDEIPFDVYVKGVLPHEWIASWEPAALEAGAVAVRTYAAAWVAAGGKYECADLDDTTASQVYGEERHPATDAAVDATAGAVLLEEGALVFAEYSAENGDPTAFGVDEPHCTGEAQHGHGRGTCQWGTQRWALHEGRDFAWIATHYYPGAELVFTEPDPDPEPTPLPLPKEDSPRLAAPGASGEAELAGGCAAAGGAGGAGAALLLGSLLLGAVFGRRGRLSRAALLAAALVAAGCVAPGAVGSDEQEGRSALGGDSALRDLFLDLQAETGVPAEVLAAISYVETRLRPAAGAGDHHHHHHHQAAPASTPAEAALALEELAGGSEPATLADWIPIVEAWRGRALAGEVEQELARGFRGRDAEGRLLIVSARPMGRVAGDGFGQLQQSLGYPGAIWDPAHGSNYTSASRGAASINYIVIHTAQGYYGGTINWFKDPAANVSAHYLVRSSDGEVTQLVDDSDIAWHDRCFNSETLGIEHEGFVGNPDAWYTEAMYMESALLTAWLADQYGIPKDRDHILGHGETPDCSDHTDPGPGWDWEHYIDLVQSGGEPELGASFAGQSFPEQMESGEEAVVWFELQNDSNITWGINETRLGTAEPEDRESPFYVDGNWLSPSRATGADMSSYEPGSVGRFTFLIRAPEVDEPTEYTESYRLVQEGAGWFGPVASASITVVPQGWDGEDDGDKADKPIEVPDDEDSDLEPPGPDATGGCSAADPGAGSGACAILLLGAFAVCRRRRVRRCVR